MGLFLGMEGGKRCPSKWVYVQRVYTGMGVFLESLQPYGCVFKGLTSIISRDKTL